MLHVRHFAPFALSDAEHSRLLQLYQLLGTGIGIRRILSKSSRVEDLFDRYTAPIGQFIAPVLRERVVIDSIFDMPDLFVGGQFSPYQLLRDISEGAGPLKEIDMAEYRALAREAHILRRKVIGWIPGLDAPPSAGRHPKSPFGPPETRFRRFDPNPAFSQRIGFIQYHQYH